MRQCRYKKQTHVNARMGQDFYPECLCPNPMFTNHQFKDLPLTLTIGIVEQHSAFSCTTNKNKNLNRHSQFSSKELLLGYSAL